MQITHYLYNAFLIEDRDKKLVIDPGALFLYWLRLSTLIPKHQWDGVTHIFITHGDPDHYWHADRVARTSGATVVCNRSMVREIEGETLMLGPRSRGLKFNTPCSNLRTLEVGETLDVDSLKITGVATTHGQLVLKLGPLSTTVHPGPAERIGWGSIGFDIQIHGRRLVNLGDTLLHAHDWQAIQQPDVLMIPIGGRMAHNTMDEIEAVEAVRIMRPEVVIPCHYNCPAFFTKQYNQADVAYFKKAVEALGSRCVVLDRGESLELSAPATS